jgi:DNA repair protein RadA/Sms
MGKVRTVLSCRECGQQLARWAGRCPGCGAWGTIENATGGADAPLETLGHEEDALERRIPTGLPGVDRVLGGGLVPSTVALLAGEPGIGKSTLLLQLAAGLSAAGHACMVASGEEARRQVSARARRLGLDGSALSYVSGRELPQVMEAARANRPALLAVDSVQSLRDPSAGQMPGGTSQVRTCVDALVGLAKAEGISVLVTGHVTKDGDLAGPRTLQHAVDVVLSFEGDPRSGQRMLSAGKNRFGAEGEVAWFEMSGSGLREIDPSALLLPGQDVVGAAAALPLAGRRALAVEVQALVAGGDAGTGRRQVSGLDLRRFQLVAAVLESVGIRLGRADVFGATAGGARLDDPAADLAVAASIASAASGIPTPQAAAFVGEIGLTGIVRPAPAMRARLSAAEAAGLSTVFVPEVAPARGGLRQVPVRHVVEALGWARPPRDRPSEAEGFVGPMPSENGRTLLTTGLHDGPKCASDLHF